MQSSEPWPILSVQNLSCGYGKKQVLFDVTFEVAAGQVLLVIGGNGSGKSTLLRAIYGLLSPWTSRAKIVFTADRNMGAMGTYPPSRNLTKGLAYVPQKNAVFDDMSVEDNLRLAGQTLRSQSVFATRRLDILERISPLRPVLARRPETLSGGERQLLAIAMVLLHRPKLLMLDEPLAGLDTANALLVANFIQSLWRTDGLTVVVVEHRTSEVRKFANCVVRLHLGHIVETTSST